MANERIIALDESARKAITARMRQRGETASTYFSGEPSDVRTVIPLVERSSDGKLVREEAPDMAILRQYGELKSDVGLRSGREQVAISMGLYDSPVQARTASWIRKNLGQQDLGMGADSSAYYVPEYKGRTGHIMKNSAIDFNTVRSMGFNVSELTKLAESRVVTPDQHNAAEYSKALLGIAKRVHSETDPAKLDALRVSEAPGSRAMLAYASPEGAMYDFDPRVKIMADAGYSRSDLEGIAEVVDAMVARRKSQLSRKVAVSSRYTTRAPAPAGGLTM